MQAQALGRSPLSDTLACIVGRLTSLTGQRHMDCGLERIERSNGAV